MPLLDSSDAQEFARISQELLAVPDQEMTLQRVVDLAVENLPGVDFAGVSLRHGGGRVETPAATDPLVNEADELQYQLNEGPCLDAIWVDDTYVIADMQAEDRWPQWAPKAAALGMRSILSVRLATESSTVGGLNLYSKDLNAYDEDSILTAHIYAAHASNAIEVRGEAEGLRTAMQTRHLIGMAQGMLILRYGLSEDQAFRFLRRRSQEANVKLRDVAAQVVQELGGSGRPA
jgi:transcriptional regulator with GAF, ATPase, and Fis domain